MIMESVYVHDRMDACVRITSGSSVAMLLPPRISPARLNLDDLNLSSPDNQRRKV